MKSLASKLRSKIGTILVLIGIGLLIYSLVPYVAGEVWYALLNYRNKHYVVTDTQTKNGKITESVFGKLLSASNEISISPANTDFSLVIEKIGVSAPVVMGVSVTDPAKYNDALRNGIAHALVSDLPSSEPGNVYLFAHASLNFWSLGKYATTFNLLRKLNFGDEINVFYHNKRYIYEVVNKEVHPGWNTYPLTRSVIEPILTLQTCDPPGTTLNRLVVTAKLKKII